MAVTLTHPDQRPPGGPLRVLFLASYFPKPTNPTMGTWALSQAQALRRAGVDVRVASFTSWVPKAIGFIGAGARRFAHCPSSHTWDELPVSYPRWLYYGVGPARRAYRTAPRWPMELAWRSAATALRREVVRFAPDVLYVHHTVPNGVLAARIRHETGLPYVTADHTFEDVTDCETSPGWRQAYEPAARAAHSLVAVSDRMAADMRRVLPGARVTTVHNGVDPPPPHVMSTPRPPGLRDRFVLFTAAMFYERKGIPLLIEAFARIAAEHPGVVLRIAGDGPGRPLVEAAVRAAGPAAARIELLGLQPHERVLQEMAWCDAFTFLGWDEPFGVVFAEAMAAGKPVVCASDGGINDVLVDGVHGLTVPPRDVVAAAAALRRVVEEPAAADRMGRAAAELARSRLSWDANAGAIVALLLAAHCDGAGSSG